MLGGTSSLRPIVDCSFCTVSCGGPYQGPSTRIDPVELASEDSAER